ncbi:hypothetical protein [Enterococcus sp. CSURQ0835]|uniref:hypothetical protein n=1 Tax=Enterococcus sp. CSURQ0835 TaxID=2681394 RepID=UPI001358A20C|nr:hypothetical protein [Enterococcus sp. CSURQ0835]
MKEKLVKEKILTALNKVTKNNFEDYESIQNFQLTGWKIGMNAVDLAYFLLELRKKFNICFTENDVKDYRFNTLKSIEIIINKKI